LTTSGTGIVLCRLAAIFYVVQAIQYSGFLLQQFRMSSFSGYDFVEAAFVAAFVPLLAASAVWYFAEKISSFQNDNADVNLTDNANIRQLVVLGTFLIGLTVFLFGIEGAVRTEVAYWAQDVSNTDGTPQDGGIWYERLSNRASYTTRLVLGLFLMAGKTLVPRIFRWARYAGTGAS